MSGISHITFLLMPVGYFLTEATNGNISALESYNKYTVHRWGFSVGVEG